MVTLGPDMVHDFCAESGTGWQLRAHNQWKFNYENCYT